MPESSPAISPAHQALIASAIGKSSRRLRLQRGLDFAVFSIIPAAASMLVVALAFKRRWIDDDGILFALTVAGALVLLAFLLGFAWRIPTITAARAIDSGAALHDRLGSAWDFEKLPESERSAFMNAAIRDAARAAQGLKVGRFVRLSRPRDLTMALVLMMSVVVFGLLRIPLTSDFVGIGPGPARPAPPPPPMVPTFQALLAQQKVEESQKEAERLKDPETKKLLSQIDKLWKGIHGHQFDKRELWRRIAALQKQKLGKLTDEDKAELGRLKKTGEQMPSTGVSQKLADALKKGDLQKAQDALRELARKLKQQSLTKKERKELEKALKKATAQTKKELQNMKRKLEKLQKQLQKRQLQKLAKEKKQRELQRLSKQLDKMQSQLTTQLSQELMDALSKMKKYEDGDAGQSLEKAGDRMKEMMKKIRKLQLMSKTQDHIKEMKDLLRRGNQQGRDQQLKDFMARAGNGQGDITLKLPGQGDQEGSGQGDGQQPGGRQLKQLGGKQCQKCGGGHATGQHGQPGQGGEGQKKGPGWGTGEGDKKLGQSTSIDDAKYNETELKGKKGRGDSTSEVFMGAATKGFSRVAYKNVYQKYKEHVEEALEKNKAIPPGQKRIVEKYFEMIRPK